MGALTWLTMSWLHKGTPSVIGAVSGAIAGLSAITPASGFVDASAAIIIGFAAGAVCYGAILLRERLKIDDALDVWAVHGVGGTLGALLTGVFARRSRPSAAPGLVEATQPGRDAALAIAATWIYSAVATLIILKVVDCVGLRVEESEEEAGLDFSQHGEVADHWPPPPLHPPWSSRNPGAQPRPGASLCADVVEPARYVQPQPSRHRSATHVPPLRY